MYKNYYFCKKIKNFTLYNKKIIIIIRKSISLQLKQFQKSQLVFNLIKTTRFFIRVI